MLRLLAGGARERFRAFDAAFDGVPHLVCYAVKANSNLAVLNILARMGSGFDIVSGGELARVIAAGGDPAKIVFSGVGKTDGRDGGGAGPPAFAASTSNPPPSSRRSTRSQGARARVAPISLRVNPDVDPEDASVHRDGLEGEQVRRRLRGGAGALPARRRASRRRRTRDRLPHRIADHRSRPRASKPPGRCSISSTGSKRTGSPSDHVDLGGGLGIRYRDEETIDPYAYRACGPAGRAARAAHELLFEPGRLLVGDAGVLLTRVHLPQARRRARLRDRRCGDERPPPTCALRCVARGRSRCVRATRRARVWQIVGPVCESADFLAHDRLLRARRRDLLAVRAAGAYGVRNELQLQLAPACVRGHRRWGRGTISYGRARTRRIFSRANPRCPERAFARLRSREASRFSMCVSATIANATCGIGGEILQFNEMWLKFRQQVAVGLSSGCSTK